jgi:hypothetical protein
MINTKYKTTSSLSVTTFLQQLGLEYNTIEKTALGLKMRLISINRTMKNRLLKGVDSKPVVSFEYTD